jgi:subtilisin family serine protease
MNYAVDNGAWVINMSFNGREASPALSDAVAYASDRGVALVVAAGNEARSEPSYPGAIKPAIAVAATTLGDSRPFFTNYGPWVDIAAPGQSIVSTYWDSTNGSIYRFETGTSAAAPLVAGVIALMFSLQPTLTVDQIVTVLTSTADPLDAMGIGAGRVNALAAARAVAPPELLTPTVEPATPTETPVPTPTIVPTNTPLPATIVTPVRSQTPLILPLITTTPNVTATASPSASFTPRPAATPGIIRVTPGFR